MSEKAINYEFKTLSALGMLCIISGHFASGLLSLHALFPYDTFHMPMFVFISGYFFKPSNADSIANVAQFIKRKIKRLIIPYYLWNLFYCAIAHILNRYTIMNIEGGIHSAVDFFLEPFRGGYGSGYNCAAWFLTALFLVETIYVLLRSIAIKTGLRGEYPILIALFALAVCMVQLSISGWSSKVSVMAIRTGYLLFWYECGYFYRTHLEKHLRKVNQWLVLLLAVAAAVVLQTFYEKGQDVRSVVFVAQFYPNIPFVFFRAALGIVFWLEISYITTPLLMKIKPVMYMADHTFSLMMHQGLAGVLINSVYRCIAPERCNDAEFTTQIWYNYPSRWEKLSYVLLVPCLVLGVVYLFQICRKQYEKRTEAARS